MVELKQRHLLSGPLVMALAFWLAANPYIGIDHDARLYVLMAYRWLAPENYANDPWFAYGSQDDWSIFSPVLAAVLLFIGVADGAKFATLIQGLLFVTASLSLGKALLRGPGGILAGLVMVSIPVLYSPNAMLYVTEGFVTARGFSVPLSLIGLAFAVQRRIVLAGAFCSLAMAFHPIMAFAPTVLSVLLLAGPRYAFNFLILGFVIVASVFVAGLNGLIPMVDDVWYPLAAPAALVFIDQWLPGEIPNLLLYAGALLAGAWFSAGSRQRFYGLVLLVGILAVAVSYVAAIVPVEIFLKAQFWRALWLVKLMAFVAIIDLILRHILRRHAPHRMLSCVSLLACFLVAMIEPLAAIISIVALRILPSGYLAAIASNLDSRRIVINGACLLLFILFLPHYFFGVTATGPRGNFVIAENEWLMGYLHGGGLGLSAILTWYLWLNSTKWFAPIPSIFFLILAFLFWDGRSDGLRSKEASYQLPGLVNGQTLVPKGKVVYWHGNPELVWFTLASSGYASTTHATGLIFSRERTLVLEKRLQRIVLATSGQNQILDENQLEANFENLSNKLPRLRTDVLASYEEATGQGLSQQGVILMCQDLRLDYVVASSEWERLAPHLIPARILGRALPLNYIYACEDIRQYKYIDSIS